MKITSQFEGAIAIKSMNLASISSPSTGYIAVDNSDSKLKFYNNATTTWENYNDVVISAITVLKGGVPSDGDTLNKLNNKIIDNTSSISALSTNKINFTDIVDNLTSSDGTTKVLSANQGRVLKNYVDTNFYFKTDFINSYVSIGVSGDKPIKTNSTTGKIDYSLLPIINSFANGNVSPTVIQQTRVHNAKLNTNGSTAVFNITSDGLIGGSALFSNLEQCGLQVSCRSTNTANNQAPWCYVQTISGNVVTVHVKRSNSGSILIGGNYNGNVDNDLTVAVYLTIIGASA